MHKNVFFDFIVSLIDRTKHHVDYKNPDLTILLEISNDLLCFTIVEKYYLYRSYNLLSLSKSDEGWRRRVEDDCGTAQQAIQQLRMHNQYERLPRNKPYQE